MMMALVFVYEGYLEEYYYLLIKEAHLNHWNPWKYYHRLNLEFVKII